MNMYIGTSLNIDEIKTAMPSLLRRDLHSTLSGGGMSPFPSQKFFHTKQKTD